MRFLLLCVSMATLTWVGAGCSKESNHSTAHEHHHETASYMPNSLGDLCRKIRDRLKQLENDQSNPQLKSELTDLVSWAPEFAADTNMDERLWIPIYESSEQVRSSIENKTDQWEKSSIEQITQLCKISEDAWKSLDPNERIERYQAHSHDKHSGHDHGDHEHGDHEHGDHEHGDHDHGDHDHGDHDHGDHDHRDHEHGDHGKQVN